MRPPVSYNTNVGGQKFGLILPASKKRPVPVKPPSSLFGSTADDDDDAGGGGGRGKSAAFLAVNEAVKRQQDVAAKQAAELEKVTMAEDAGIFDYDSWLDKDESAAAKRQKRTAAAVAAPVERKPQYMLAMLEVARKRELESERVYERKLIKEQKKDEEEFGQLEKYVTKGYKAKLEERRAKEEEERRRDALNEDVTKKKDLTGFYRHLMNEVAGEAPSKQPPVAEPAPGIATVVPPAATAVADAAPAALAPADTSSVPSEGARAEEAVAAAAAAAAASSGASADAVSAAPAVSKEDAIAAARERALARRKQKAGTVGADPA